MSISFRSQQNELLVAKLWEAKVTHLKKNSVINCVTNALVTTEWIAKWLDYTLMQLKYWFIFSYRLFSKWIGLRMCIPYMYEMSHFILFGKPLLTRVDNRDLILHSIQLFYFTLFCSFHQTFCLVETLQKFYQLKATLKDLNFAEKFCAKMCEKTTKLVVIAWQNFISPHFTPHWIGWKAHSPWNMDALTHIPTPSHNNKKIDLGVIFLQVVHRHRAWLHLPMLLWKVIYRKGSLNSRER